MKILNIVGARPNFMKIAPLIEEMKKYPKLKPLLVHTGQHYGKKMSDSFFRDLGIPKPDVNLGIGSGSHAVQTSDVMVAFEKLCLKEKPDLVLVVGDVNSTLACSLVAAKLCIPVAHVEAGLRSGDRTMPEEINRIVTDALSDYLFTTSPDAAINLKKEGISQKKIFFVGNVMIDTLLKFRKKAKTSNILNRLDLTRKGAAVPFALITLHRPSNVDDKKVLSDILKALETIQKKIKVIFPIHPRTQKQIKAFGMTAFVKRMPNLILTEPIGYLDTLALMQKASFVLTDSGGVQEETTVLGVPCLTVRKNTERPVTITQGTNVLVGVSKARIVSEAKSILKGKARRKGIPKYWDGRAAKRIVSVIRRKADSAQRRTN